MKNKKYENTLKSFTFAIAGIILILIITKLII